MVDKGPMFDLEDCEDVDLEANKTTSEKLVQAKRTKRLRGRGNEVGTSATDSQTKPWHETAWGKVVIGVIIGAVLIAAKLIFG